ncbi:hypothetical protein KAW48_02160 [candidate division WOR-3 bacterium]|nr:hypothetical protein [candidate division WOR-3 bacterium]
MRKICILLLLSGALFLVKAAREDVTSSESENQQKLPEVKVLASFELVQPLLEVPERMMVYRTVDPKITRDDVRRLMKIFGFEGQIDDRKRQFVVKDQDKVLEVFKQPGTGYLRYSNNTKLAIEEEVKNIPSEDEAISKAEKFLKSYGFLPENTFLNGVQYYEFSKYDSVGKTIAHGKSAISVGFGFKIEGMKVEGPGAKASVIFGENGEIIGASKIWREIEPDKEMKIITPEDAFAKFKQRWPREAEPKELEKAEVKTKVNIREVYVTYYAEPGCLPESHIKPVYIFKGDYQISGKVGEREIKDSDYFKIVIPAIPKE